MQPLTSTTRCWVMQLDLMEGHMSVVAPPLPVFTAFLCTSPNLSNVLSLTTGNFTTRFRNAKSDSLTDNRNPLLAHMDCVMRGLFCRDNLFAVADLRSYIHQAMEGMKKVCAGMDICRRKRDMTSALFVRSCRALLSYGGMARPGSMLFANHRWWRHEPQNAHTPRILRCLHANAWVTCSSVLPVVFICIESTFLAFNRVGHPC